jgi:hypothetical protein
MLLLGYTSLSLSERLGRGFPLVSSDAFEFYNKSRFRLFKGSVPPRLVLTIDSQQQTPAPNNLGLAAKRGPGPVPRRGRSDASGLAPTEGAKDLVTRTEDSRNRARDASGMADSAEAAVGGHGGH